MIITKRFLPRRTFLRGMGAAVALPLLDGMVPALTALSQTAAKPVRRFGVVYLPNGQMMTQWTPASVGSGFDLSPILKPFEPFRDDMLVLSGLTNTPANAGPGDGPGDHSRGAAAFLSAVRPKRTEGADIQAGITIDQIAANEIGKDTQLASLELSLEPGDMVGACDIGYSCAYMRTISWRSPTTPLPMEANPRAVFERLFGDSDSTDPRVRLARIQEDRSLLDSIAADASSLKVGLSSRDGAKLTEYLEAIRAVERRIQKAEEQSAREMPVVEQPFGIPNSFVEHAELMFDLLTLALQSDLTRVFTFQIGQEGNNASYPESGVPDDYHAMSHHQNNPERMAKYARVNVFHAHTAAYLFEKLQSAADGNGSLLDHSMILYGGGISDGNSHIHTNLPLALFGKGAGQLVGGRHLKYEKDTPVANLYVSLLDKLGVRAEQIGNSTGTVSLSAI